MAASLTSRYSSVSRSNTNMGCGWSEKRSLKFELACSERRPSFSPACAKAGWPSRDGKERAELSLSVGNVTVVLDIAQDPGCPRPEDYSNTIGIESGGPTANGTFVPKAHFSDTYE